MNRRARTELEVTLRKGRQLTLPARACEALGLEAGDTLQVSVEDDGLLVRPKKALARRALREIRRAFADSDVTEQELLAEARRVREQVSRARYGRG